MEEIRENEFFNLIHRKYSILECDKHYERFNGIHDHVYIIN